MNYYRFFATNADDARELLSQIDYLSVKIVGGDRFGNVLVDFSCENEYRIESFDFDTRNISDFDIIIQSFSINKTEEFSKLTFVASSDYAIFKQLYTDAGVSILAPERKDESYDYHLEIPVAGNDKISGPKGYSSLLIFDEIGNLTGQDFNL